MQKETVRRWQSCWLKSLVVSFWDWIRFTASFFRAYVVAAVILTLPGCERFVEYVLRRTIFCDKVETEEKAFELSKKFILEHKREKLKYSGADASIFERGVVGEFQIACNRPPRYHFARRDPDYGSFDVVWVTFLKGSCEGCWDTTSISAVVGRCGAVGDVRAYRPAPYEFPNLRKNKKIGSYCGPNYWPP